MSWLGVGVRLGPGATAGLRLGLGFRVRVEGPHLVHVDGLGVATYLLTYTYGRTHLEAQVRVDPVAASGVDPHEVLGRDGLLLIEHGGRACWVGLGVGVVSK